MFNIDGSQQGGLHSKGVGGDTLEGEELSYRRFGASKGTTEWLRMKLRGEKTGTGKASSVGRWVGLWSRRPCGLMQWELTGFRVTKGAVGTNYFGDGWTLAISFHLLMGMLLGSMLLAVHQKREMLEGDGG